MAELNNNPNGPARGAAQVKQAGQVSSVVSNAREVTPNQGIVPVAPSSEPVKSSKVPSTIEGFGDIAVAEKNDGVSQEEIEGGTGPYCVVLSHYLSVGFENAVGYRRGDVRRLSKLVPNFSDPKKKDVVQATIVRLFEGDAIRQATESEAFKATTPGQNGRIEIRAGASTEMNEAHAATVRAEQERDELAKQLDLIYEANPSLRPGTETKPAPNGNDEQF